ncbi:MAG: hypothetical protein Q8P22_10250 [Chloroflexota bacterium]|nr:hypothetical protein [Chloroflexota bacterium]
MTPTLVRSATLATAAQRRRECEELEEQFAALFWHYPGRPLRAVDKVEFALMETRVRCLLREFGGEAGRLPADGPP